MSVFLELLQHKLILKKCNNWLSNLKKKKSDIAA